MSRSPQLCHYERELNESAHNSLRVLLTNTATYTYEELNQPLRIKSVVALMVCTRNSSPRLLYAHDYNCHAIRIPNSASTGKLPSEIIKSL